LFGALQNGFGRQNVRGLEAVGLHEVEEFVDSVFQR